MENAEFAVKKPALGQNTMTELEISLAKVTSSKKIIINFSCKFKF